MPNASALKNGDHFAAGSDTPLKPLLQAVNGSTGAHVADSRKTDDVVEERKGCAFKNNQKKGPSRMSVDMIHRRPVYIFKAI